MQRFTWVIVLVVVVAAGIHGLCQCEKPIPPARAVPTLETALQQLAGRAVYPAQAREFAASLGMVWEEGRVHVVVEMTDSFSSPDITKLGGEVLARADALNMLEVEIPAVQLVELACLPGVSFVRRPYRPVPVVVSEGVEVSGAGSWPGAGYLGQGTRVAVIDVEFGGLSAALTAGELGDDLLIRDYTGAGIESGGPHGTACAEIVHDMAPGAELLLMKIGNEVQLANAVADATALGVNVITHSVGWFNTNFYDGTGPIVEIVSSALQAGILWVNATGNSGDGGHWEGEWQDVDGDDWLNYTPTDEKNEIYLSAGEPIILWLTWDGWPETDQDYDLFLVDEGEGVVASSQNYQTGTQEPTEVIIYIAPVAGNYGIRISAYTAPAHPRLELFCSLALPFEHQLAESSIPAPANASSVLAVGAIDWENWATGPKEPFSSQGPTNASRLAASITKPDICGPDGVSGLSYGLNSQGGGFYGTSAAAPHLAGAAALVWSAQPGWEVTDVRGWLQDNAIDMGAVGKDNLYGYGRLDLPLSIEPPPPTTGECLELEAGWNLISLPLEPGSNSPQAVFDEVTGMIYLYAYDPATGGWRTVENGLLTEVGPLDAYYLWLPSDTEICVDGTALSGDQTLGLGAAGWSTIGVPYPLAWGDSSGGLITITNAGQTKSLENAVAAGWIYNKIWSYDPTTETWFTPTIDTGVTLDPWTGYWIYTFVDGLVLNFTEGEGPGGGPPSPVLSETRSVHMKSPGSPPIPGAPLSFSPDRIEFDNTPNPIRDVHTTKFTVKGVSAAMVDRFKVRIFDLSGRLVYEGEEQQTTSLDWHTEDEAGEYLANGVYLYKLYVLVDGQWVVSEVKKVAILR